MSALLRLYLDICLLRRGPQDVPASSPLMQFTLAVYALIGLPKHLGGLAALSVFQSLWLTVVDLALLIGLCYAALYWVGHLSRFRQTLTALAGAGVVLSIVELPLSVWLRRAVEAERSYELPLMLAFGLLAWSLLIVGHILQHAFSISRGAGLVCALGYTIIAWVAIDLLVLRVAG